MPTIEQLLLEKRRYSLEEKISNEEKEKLLQGMPVQKIIGYIDIDDVIIDIDKFFVLIPRYETMELVDLIKKNYLEDKMKVLDLCCGSGYIGIALKKFNNSIEVTSSDNDSQAIEATIHNALRNNLEIKVMQSNLFEEIDQKYDLIVSNPPYLDKTNDPVDVSVLKWEPDNALFTSDDGWFFYEKILKEYKNFLNKNGYLFLEINPRHTEKWKQIKNATIIKDINNKNRFVIIKNV
ncbi:peptide chain release factor N(5)-glutamine methyltransferase [Mycoplasmopsis hyopharyngis]|uniref:peptide chain release factor N(5)-glutamine methyltransferase n=1 Tax=Mycoplasmopsis hyopharyngis TaxID=29558 RepID=UPI0038733FC8